MLDDGLRSTAVIEHMLGRHLDQIVAERIFLLALNHIPADEANMQRRALELLAFIREVIRKLRS